MAWGVVNYQAPGGEVPAHEFLLGCPTAVRAKLLAVLEVFRAAPPPAFSSGGKWEAMHGKMNGYYEIHCTGPGRRHYRLYCILDNGTTEELARRGFDRPQIAVINGLVKPAQPSGSIQRSSRNRAKSVSAEQSATPCSSARAARCASGMRLPAIW